MTPLFRKLNYKDVAEILVLNAPATFEVELTALGSSPTIHRMATEVRKVTFAIAFARKQGEVDRAAQSVATRLDGDGIFWIAYPKASSKRLAGDFNRDTGWTVLGELGFEPVRQVAIDEDWSALRFRRVEYIKKMTRSAEGTLTEAGKSKTTDRGRKPE